MFSALSILVISFVVVWVGSGFVLRAITQISKRWRISEFMLSFFLLGIMTSLPEISIGISSILHENPEIFVGNLLGAVIVLFLFVIPLLAIFGNGVSAPRKFQHAQMVFILAVIAMPSLLTIDQTVSRGEAIAMIVVYFLLFLFFSVQEEITSKLQDHSKHTGRFGFVHALKFLFGAVLLIIGGWQIVEATTRISQELHIASFFVSLLLVALGTNLPEISIIIRSVLALGDYLGSASANTLLFGLFSLIHGETIRLPNHILQRFFFIMIGLVLFFFFSKTKHTLSRREGLFLLGLYVCFFVGEVVLTLYLTP